MTTPGGVFIRRSEFDDQPGIQALIGQEEYHATGVYDDVRFERHVRSHLRKIAKMAKTNEAFEKMLHHQ